LCVALNLEPVGMFGWRIHVGHENSYQIAIKSLFWPKCWIASYNTQEAISPSVHWWELRMWSLLAKILNSCRVEGGSFIHLFLKYCENRVFKINKKFERRLILTYIFFHFLLATYGIWGKFWFRIEKNEKKLLLIFTF
jgi:hypothetical protein